VRIAAHVIALSDASVTSSSLSQHDLSEKREELLRISAERDDLLAGQRVIPKAFSLTYRLFWNLGSLPQFRMVAVRHIPAF
jgi:hypothetical protein